MGKFILGLALSAFLLLPFAHAVALTVEEPMCQTVDTLEVLLDKRGGYAYSEELDMAESLNLIMALTNGRVPPGLLEVVDHMINYVSHNNYMVYSAVFDETGCLVGAQNIPYANYKQALLFIGR